MMKFALLLAGLSLLVGNWSRPIRLDGQGTKGSTVTVQYSVDGATNWHDTFTSGDLYMRQKVGKNLCTVNVTDGNEGGTTTGGETAPDGTATAEKHVQTHAGRIIYDGLPTQAAGVFTGSLYLKGKLGGETVTLRCYRNRDYDEAIIVTAILTTAWQRFSGVHTYGSSGLNRMALYSAKGQTLFSWGWQVEPGSILNSYALGSWSDAIRIVGEQSATGHFIDHVFKRAASQPDTPIGNGTPSGWSDAPPAADGNPLWMSVAEKTAPTS